MEFLSGSRFPISSRYMHALWCRTRCLNQFLSPSFLLQCFRQPSTRTSITVIISLLHSLFISVAFKYVTCAITLCKIDIPHGRQYKYQPIVVWPCKCHAHVYVAHVSVYGRIFYQFMSAHSDGRSRLKCYIAFTINIVRIYGMKGTPQA